MDARNFDKTGHVLYIYRNTAASSRNNFAVETQHCVLCVAELDVTVNYIKIFSDAQQCLVVNLYHWQQGKIICTCQLLKKYIYVYVYIYIYIPTNLRSLYTLQTNDTLKQKNVRLRIVFFRSTVWLNRSQNTYKLLRGFSVLSKKTFY